MSGSERDRIEQRGTMRGWAEIRRLARVYVLRVGQRCMLDATGLIRDSVTLDSPPSPDRHCC